ncbi:DUF3313 family protein [Paraburkholderia domus]|uniref:DUF3313 family protein n=1 Tax=Paraburkholderia domus TaxID=2793075 RepID=UPI001B147D30|nr:DUF3313 family protein [Paraburkholderia domus]CAE6714063.1 hypothetical protein R75483_01442 [Paraburkholderia domus]
MKPVAYSGIASSSSLQPNQQDESGRVPYRLSTQADWRKYGRLIVDPVVVYRGADNQFGSMQDKDKAIK